MLLNTVDSWTFAKMKIESFFYPSAVSDESLLPPHPSKSDVAIIATSPAETYFFNFI